MTNNTGAVKRSYVLAFLVCILLVGVLGYGYLVHHRQIVMEQSRNELSAIADLKAEQIRQWRRERLNDATVIRNNVMAAHRLNDYLNGTAGPEVLGEFETWLKSLRLNRYHNADLLKPDGELLVSGQNRGAYTAPDPMHRGMIAAAVRDNQVVFSDFHKDAPTGETSIDLIIPIHHADGNHSRPIAVLVLSIAPGTYLYPLIQSWPTPSLTAETLLVERNGDDVLFLNDVRHLKDTAIALRRPLANRDMPAARAVLGQEGIFEGFDYRGVAVLAATRTISGSPWAIVAKVDTAEIFGPVVRRAWLVAAASLAMTLVAGLGLYLLWNRKHALYLRRQYEGELRFNAELAEAAETLKISENRMRTITSSAQDAIVMLDERGDIAFWNEAAERLFGFDSEEILGKSCHDHLTPLRYREAFRKAFPDFRKTGEGSVIGKTVELAALRKDGTEFPIELSLSSVQVKGRWHAIGMIRDITERRQAEEDLLHKQRQLEELNLVLEQRVEERTSALQQQLDFTQTLLDAIPNPVFFKDLEGRYLGCNRAYEEFKGTSRESLCGKCVFDTVPADLAGEIHAMDQEVLRFSGTGAMETSTRTADGSLREVIYHRARFDDKTGNQAGLICVIQDITDLKAAEATIRKHNAELELKVRERTLSLENVNFELDIINKELEEKGDEAEAALTALLRSQKEVRDVSERLRLATAAARIGIWDYDIGGGRMIWDDAMCRLYGFEEGCFAGEYEAWEACLHPDDLHIVREALRRALRGELEFNPEFRVVWPDGSVRYIKANGMVQRDTEGRPLRMLGTNWDTTEHTIAGEKLLKLSRAVENSPATVVITDVAGFIEYVNPKFTEISGYTAEEVIGRNPRILNAHLLPPEFYTHLWATIRDGREWRGEFCNRKKNHEIHWENASISPIRDDSGKITHYVAVKEDITEWKRNAAELERAKEAADSANRSKSEFLANMSHEIRTPLNAIIGFSSLALKADLPSPQQDYIQKIGNAGESLLTIINDILDFSKIEAGKLEMEATLFRLDYALADAISVVQQKALEKKLHLFFEVSPGIPQYLIGDSHRLGQVIANLLGNAIKFTEKGEVELAARLREQSGTRITVQFSIRDTGIGLSDEHMAKLFQPFTQADGSMTRRFGGTGLGLSISRQLVEMMGGEIWCESNLGTGSTFSFSACFGMVDDVAGAATLLAERKRPRDETLYDFSGAKVLLVEDSEINRQLVMELLKDTGARVDIALNGQEGVEMATRENSAYDLVLMDIQMPVMDGYEAIGHIRSDRRSARLPIIAMTAHAMKEEQQRIANIGVEDYITKPINARATLRIMSRYLSKAGSNVEADDETMAASVAGNCAVPAIPGLDCAGALARVDGNLELYLWVLQSFVDGHAGSAKLVANAVHQGDLELAERTVHTVKGVAGVMGADNLAESALLLENALRLKAARETVGDMLHRYTRELDLLIRTLLKILPPAGPENDSESTAGTDPETLTPILARLHLYIKEKDGRTERYLDHCRDALSGLPRNHLEQLRKCLATFDFEGAEAALAILAEQTGIGLTPNDSGTLP